MKKLLFLCSFLLASLASADTAFQTYYPPGYAWASKPTCAAAITGMQIRVTDVGPNDWVAVCDGSVWAPTAPIVLCNIVGDVAGSLADTNEHRFSGTTCTVPAGLPQANSSISISTLWQVTDGDTAADNNIWKVRYSSTDADTGGTVYHQLTTTNAATVQIPVTEIRFSATNAQRGFPAGTSTGTGAVSGGTPVTSSIDSTSTSYVLFTSTIADTANDTMVYKAASVIYNP